MKKQQNKSVPTQNVLPDIQQIVSTFPADKQADVLKQLTVEQHYSGPIPPPVLLKQFNEIIPNGADRILSMTEKEQKFRHKSTNWLIADAIIRRVFGLVFSVGLILVLIYVAYKLGMAGYVYLAGTICTVTIIGIAVVFVLFKEPTNNKLNKNNK